MFFKQIIECSLSPQLDHIGIDCISVIANFLDVKDQNSLINVNSAFKNVIEYQLPIFVQHKLVEIKIDYGQSINLQIDVDNNNSDKIIIKDDEQLALRTNPLLIKLFPSFVHVDIEYECFGPNNILPLLISHFQQNSPNLKTLFVKSNRNPFNLLTMPLSNLESLRLQAVDIAIRADVSIQTYLPRLKHLDISRFSSSMSWFTRTPIHGLKQFNAGTVNNGYARWMRWGNVKITPATEALENRIRIGMNETELEDFCVIKNRGIEEFQVDARLYTHARPLLKIISKFPAVNKLEITNYEEEKSYDRILLDNLIELKLYSDSSILIPWAKLQAIPRNISLNMIQILVTAPVYDHSDPTDDWLPFITNHQLKILTVHQYLTILVLDKMATITPLSTLQQFTIKCQCANWRHEKELGPNQLPEGCGHDATVGNIVQLCSSKQFPRLHKIIIICAWLATESIYNELQQILFNTLWSMKLATVGYEEHIHLTHNRNKPNNQIGNVA